MTTIQQLWYNNLPPYGQAGQGWPVCIWQKRNNDTFRQYTKNEFHAGAGISARIINLNGEDYILAPFIALRDNQYYSASALWTYLDYFNTNTGTSLQVPEGGNHHFTKLVPGEIYIFWRKLSDNSDPFLIVFPAEYNNLMIGHPPAIESHLPHIEGDNNTDYSNEFDRGAKNYNSYYILATAVVIVLITLTLIFKK
jgi:hypothetical protein